MTREQIEKAAGEYSGSVLGFKDNPVVMNKHKAFMDGAQWRINSVWHDVKEIPNTGKFVLIQLSGSERVLILFFLKKRDYLNFIKRENVIGWAYVSDLLPERKEETNGGR